MADKQVKIEIKTEEDLSGVQSLESRINQLKKQKLQLDIETNTNRLTEVESEIETVKSKLKSMEGKADVDDSEVIQLEKELEALESEKLDLEIAVESGKLEAVKAEAEELDGTTIDVDVNNVAAMEAVEQIGQGFDRLKSGASEIGQQLGSVLESAGRMENTETFLKMNLGADEAVTKLNEIRNVTDSLPGDDVVLQNLLSQAAIQDLNLAKEDFQVMGSAAADYMAAMENFGKTSKETQQDLMNYILAGNTAELEGSPILQDKINKLKEGTTVQERAKLLAEAINEAHWGGISSQDTYNNKMQQFNDMLERGKMNMGGLFLEATKGGMDFLLQLDSATGGLVGMGIALASFASPITDVVMGLGQIATGLNALKDAGDLIGLGDKFSSLKKGLLDVADAAKKAAVDLASAGKKALIAGGNAVKSAAMWVVEKAAKIASTAASYAMAAAQAVLNAVMSMNPIMLVVIALIALAAALVWAYYNVDWFREMVDNAWQTIQSFAGWIAGAFIGTINNLGAAFQNAGQIIRDSIQGAVNWVIGALQNLWTYITTLGGLIPENASITGNAVIDTVLKVITFIATLPAQLGMIFVNAIAESLGFGENFSQNMIQGAADAVNGFLEWITQLPIQVEENLAQVVESTITWLTSLWQSITEITLLIAEALAFPFVNIGLIVYESMMTVWSTLTGILAMAWTTILTFGQQLIATVMSVLSSVMASLAGAMAYFATIPGTIAGYLSNVLSRVVSWGSSMASNFLSAASKSVSNFASQISQIPSKLGSELSSALDKVNEWAATLPAKFWQAGVDAVKNFLSALGIASPGTMQRMLVWEVTEMGRRIPEESKQLLTNVSRLGQNIVDEFGEPTLGVNFDDTANASIVANAENGSTGMVNNFYFSDIVVDSDERMEQIYDYITKQLNWNNLTAGRTV